MTNLLQLALYTAISPFDNFFSTELSTDPVDKISNFLIIDPHDDFLLRLFNLN